MSTVRVGKYDEMKPWNAVPFWLLRVVPKMKPGELLVFSMIFDWAKDRPETVELLSPAAAKICDKNTGRVWRLSVSQQAIAARLHMNRETVRAYEYHLDRVGLVTDYDPGDQGGEHGFCVNLDVLEAYRQMAVSLGLVGREFEKLAESPSTTPEQLAESPSTSLMAVGGNTPQVGGNTAQVGGTSATIQIKNQIINQKGGTPSFEGEAQDGPTLTGGVPTLRDDVSSPVNLGPSAQTSMPPFGGHEPDAPPSAAPAPTPVAPTPSPTYGISPNVPTNHVAVGNFELILGRKPTATDAGLISTNVADNPLSLDTWRKVLATWSHAGWSRTNLTGILDRYNREYSDTLHGNYKLANGFRCQGTDECKGSWVAGTKRCYNCGATMEDALAKHWPIEPSDWTPPAKKKFRKDGGESLADDGGAF